jgi:fatty-acyl-CoA synthase
MGLFDSLSREAVYISSIGRALFRVRQIKPDSPVTIVDIMEHHAARRPNAPAILFGDEIVSYAALNKGADAYAHWAKSQQVGHRDVVGLLMENRPDYIMAWLGLHKVGAVVALINANARGAPLVHSISIAGARHLILGSELFDSYAEIRSELNPAPVAWMRGGTAPGLESLDNVFASLGNRVADPEWRAGMTCKEKAFYVFTSGTTGLPKAANISHMRTLFMMNGFAEALRAKSSDRLYNVLPLYHSSGGIAALGPPFLKGGSLVLRRKFSVHEFWDDCFRYRPTFFQYIGELCRYLLNAPPHVHERDHALRAITGNGLRPEIWATFQKRFAIPRIVEFYGSTEGNVSMLSYDGRLGAVGRVPSYMRRIFKTRIVRFDIEREQPIRGSDGFCIECADNEIGEAIGKIEQEPGRNFEGYTRTEDTQKKVLRDVFELGDAWFSTGDLMRRDSLGYFYFVDRIGDTFRWKGENVATSEVAEALGVVAGVLEANVYGVAIPGQDGRAGMAALVATTGFDPGSLYETLSRNLAAFAIPIFLRLRSEMEITGTFKLRKIDLVNEGFDPEKISDPLYFLDPQLRRYRPLDSATYTAITSGQVKL